MEVVDFMTSDPVTITTKNGLDEAMRLMDEGHIRHLPVVDDGKLVGIVSDRDLLEATGWLPAGLEPGNEDRTVGDIMHAKPVTAELDDRVVTISVEIVLRGIGCLPVLKGGAVVGIVTETDLLHAYSKACAERRLLGDLDPRVSDHMTEHAVTVEPDASLGEAWELRRTIDIRHLPVVSDGKVVGMVSDRDLRRALGRHQPDGLAVETIMTPDVRTIAPSDLLSTAAGIMAEHKVSALPVVEAGRLAGIVTMTDVLDHCMHTLRDPESYE